jgi:hypothetical protein
VAASKRGYVSFRIVVASGEAGYFDTIVHVSVPSRSPAPLPQGLDGGGERVALYDCILGFVWLVGGGLSEGADGHGCGGSLKSLEGGPRFGLTVV